MDREQIQQLAKENGCKLSDLLASDRTNDPFYQGGEADHRNAKWFADIWKNIPHEHGNHIRGLHYALLNHKVKLPYTMMYVDKPTGEERNTDIYINVRNCFAFLNKASKSARWLGYVPFTEFDDERTPDPFIFHDSGYKGAGFGYENIDPHLSVSAELPDCVACNSHIDGRVYLVEVWTEKSSAMKVLRPVCQSLGANLIYVTGQMSITACLELAERAKCAERPARIFYVADCDKWGNSMSRAVARKLEWFIRNDGYEIDVKLTPIALTGEQIDQFNLPIAPDSDPEKPKVEIDALIQLAPGELEKVTRESIAPYCEANIDDWIASNFDEFESDQAEAVRAAIGDELAARQSAYYDRLMEVKRELRSQFDELSSEIYAVLGNTDIDARDYLTGMDDVFADALIDEDIDFMFDSEREFIEQAESYQRFKW